MNSVRNRIQRVLATLEEAQVRYLVVGGVAVVLHGYLRTTLDLDLVIQLEDGNLAKALRGLEALGYQPRVSAPMAAFADRATRESWIRHKNMLVFSLWHPDQQGFVLDLFVEEPFDFDEVYSRALLVSLPETKATVIALEDLILMKRQAGRPRDLEDVEALLEMRRVAGEGEAP